MKKHQPSAEMKSDSSNSTSRRGLHEHNGFYLSKQLECIANSGGENIDEVILEGKVERERDAVAEEEERKNAALSTFDIFSSSPTTDTGLKAVNGENRRTFQSLLLEGEDPHLQSNWDDGDGYYKARVGELICDRYKSMGIVGKVC